jgi:hypothetical protein
VSYRIGLAFSPAPVSPSAFLPPGGVFAIGFYEFSYGAVVCSLYFRRENTAGELTILPVIRNTFTAPAFSGAWLIGTGALCFVGFNITFHGRTSTG